MEASRVLVEEMSNVPVGAWAACLGEHHLQSAMSHHPPSLRSYGSLLSVLFSGGLSPGSLGAGDKTLELEVELQNVDPDTHFSSDPSLLCVDGSASIQPVLLRLSSEQQTAERREEKLASRALTALLPSGGTSEWQT